MSLSSELPQVVELARSAGKIVLEKYGKVERLTKTHAAATDEAVTEADRATQRHIVAGLHKLFPGDGIIGEESDAGDAITFECKDPLGRNWVIDPIDGTNNFIAGYGAFAVCIGLLDKGEPVLGVVYDVTRDFMFSAARGSGAFLNGKPIHVLATTMTDASMLMLTSNLLGKEGQCPSWVSHFMGQTAWKVRILGSAALEAVQVAAGIAHGAITINGKLWDVTAPAAIVMEAGGLVLSLNGDPIFPFNLDRYTGAKVPFVACAKSARDDLLARLAQYP